MGFAMVTNFFIVGVNTMLLTILLALYGRMMAQAATRFTLGLMLFAGALWAQCAVQLYFMATMMPLFVGGLQGVVLAQNLLAMFATAFLLAVTIDPVGGRAKPEASADSGRLDVDPDVS